MKLKTGQDWHIPCLARFLLHFGATCRSRSIWQVTLERSKTSSPPLPSHLRTARPETHLQGFCCLTTSIWQVAEKRNRWPPPLLPHLPATPIPHTVYDCMPNKIFIAMQLAKSPKMIISAIGNQALLDHPQNPFVTMKCLPVSIEFHGSQQC